MPIETNNEILLARAAKASFEGHPEAKHVAVSRLRDYAEPCYWFEPGQCLVDEPTAAEGWGGGYKKDYWAFFTIEAVRTAQAKET